MRLGMSWSYPGVYKSKINEQQAIELLEGSLKKTAYIEGVSSLIRLFVEVGDMERKSQWEKILGESEKNKLHAPYGFLNIFKEKGWKNNPE